MKNTREIDTPAKIKETGNGVRGSIERKHTSVNLTANLFDWVTEQAKSRGLTLSAYMEIVFRAEYERQTNPPPLAYVTKDAKGQIVAIPLKQTDPGHKDFIC